MATKLRSQKEIREELIAKSEEAKRFTDAARQADGSWDVSGVSVGTGSTDEEKLAWFRGMQKQIGELAEELEQTRELDDAHDHNGQRVKELTEPDAGAKLHHPHGGLVAPTAGGFDSFGKLFTNSQAFKGYERVAKRGPAVEMELAEDHFVALFGGGSKGWEQKTLLTETGFAPQAVRTGLIVPGALRRPVVADVIPQGTTSQIAIVYMEETTTTNAAAAVAEGGTKPESALAFTQRTDPVQKIATWLPVTDELLADEPAMRSYIEARLRVFLALEEEDQLLNGDGTPPNISGFFDRTGTQTYTQGSGADPTETIMDAFYHAMVLVQVNAFLDASAGIINPLDWETVRIAKTSEGAYIWGHPSEPGPDRMWGLPIVRTTALAQGSALVGAFDTASQMFRRSEVAFAVSDQHSDYFVKNQLAVRVEERFALAVYRPAAFVELTLESAA